MEKQVVWRMCISIMQKMLFTFIRILKLFSKYKNIHIYKDLGENLG